MKNLILTVFLFFIANFFSAQEQQEVNAFQKSENKATGTSSASSSAAINPSGLEQVESGPGNPPGDDDIPIDNHVLLLAGVGVFIIINRFRYKIKFL
jgi:hypothetical protein